MSVPNSNSTASLANWCATTESEQLWNIWNATNAGVGGDSDVAVGVDGVTRVPLNVNAAGELKVNVEASIDADLAQIESQLNTIIGIETPQAADVAAIKSSAASIAGMAIPPNDFISLSYTGANLTGVVYKTGGAGGTTVATLTLAYSGSNLISVTKS
jgi:hypothetical protein